jgi:AAA domain
MIEAKGKRVLQLSQVQPESIQWLWPGRMAAGKLTLLDGDPGLGKSMMTLDLAARVTTGREFPDGAAGGEPAGVVLVGGEDGVSDTIIARLQAAGADLSRVHTFDGTSRDGVWRGLPTFPEDCGLLEEAVGEAKARLVIIDPLLAFISSNVWSVNDQMVRQALAPLARVAEKTRAAMILVRHLNKWGGGQRAIYRGSGSIGIIGSARTAFLVGRDPEEPDMRVLACTKNNLGAPPASLSFRIVGVDQDRARVEWAGPVEVTAEELVQVPSHRRGELLPRAVLFLEKLLSKGPCSRESVLRKTRAYGIANRTLKRARGQLSVVSQEVRENNQNVWYWSLPDYKAAEEKADDYPADGQALPATDEQRRRLEEALKM